MNKRLIIWIGLVLLILACNMGIVSPTPSTNLLATLAASTPGGFNSTPANATPTSAFNVATPIPITATPFTPEQTSSAVNPPTGKIVFTCQVFKVTAADQICIINADGTGFRRLSADDNRQHYYPSLAPDGKSVIYAEFTEKNYFDVFEMNLAKGNVTQLTDKIGNINAPEISPDGKKIIFKRWNANLNMDVMYTMDRNGGNVARFSRIGGWDPTWSPDGQSVLFASNADGPVQLYSSFLNDRNLHRVSNLPAMGGRSDWSPDGLSIVAYAGEAWRHEVYIMNVDGSGTRVLSPEGGNAQGPSFSPDGKWVAFTAYYDHDGDDNGCEIYILRVDGTDLRRLTDNDYCDYQPRWGP
jgi:TolB protein